MENAGESPRDNVGLRACPSVPGSMAPRTQNAAVERRKASARAQTDVAPQGVLFAAAPFGAPLPHLEEQKGAPGASKHPGAHTAVSEKPHREIMSGRGARAV